MRLVFDPGCQNCLTGVGTSRRRLDDVHEPAHSWSANDESIGLLTAHGPIVSTTGPSSLARLPGHPGESILKELELSGALDCALS
jgi:hypothetical protein